MNGQQNLWSLCRVQASVFSLTLCYCCTVAGQSKLAKAVLKLFGASLCSGWNLLNPPGYPRKPAVQCVHSPVVARGKCQPSADWRELSLHQLPDTPAASATTTGQQSECWGLPIQQQSGRRSSRRSLSCGCLESHVAPQIHCNRCYLTQIPSTWQSSPVLVLYISHRDQKPRNPVSWPLAEKSLMRARNEQKYYEYFIRLLCH